MQKEDEISKESKYAEVGLRADSLSEEVIRRTDSISSHSLAWCTWKTNQICVVDLLTKKQFPIFTGAQLTNTEGSWPRLKEIPNTKLLISVHNSYQTSGNMQLFGISKKTSWKHIYSFEETFGAAGLGDVTYNPRRNILGVISLAGITAYHLFNIQFYATQSNYSMKLLRRSSWPSQFDDYEDKWISSLDFDPSGEFVSTFHQEGVCLVSNLNSGASNFQLKIGEKLDKFGRCRWSTNIGDPMLFVKYDLNHLNIVDTEKQALVLKDPVYPDTKDQKTLCIDVCPNNGNLLATGGSDQEIKIYDRRVSKIVKDLDGIHSDFINCVRWNSSGDLLGSASDDMTAKVIDIKTGKAILTQATSDGSIILRVC